MFRTSVFSDTIYCVKRVFSACLILKGDVPYGYIQRLPTGKYKTSIQKASGNIRVSARLDLSFLSLLYTTKSVGDNSLVFFAIYNKAYCLGGNYLFIAFSTATATATVAPTIGLLPIPIRPIIST